MIPHMRRCFCIKKITYSLLTVQKFTHLKGMCYSSTIYKRTSEEKSNELFNEEKRRQIEDVGRIEKIVVKVNAPPEDIVLYMNQNISTPYDCSRHISEEMTKRAVLALIDSSVPWDMHRPLEKDCNLRFLSFLDDDPSFVNKAFWESCCIILGAVISKAFKDGIPVTLHSYPKPDIKSGSFVYDVKLPLDNWNPTVNELKILSAEMVTFNYGEHKFERLCVNKDLALQIMKGNSYKEDQIIAEASANQDMVTLCRVGTHIDICEGPLIGNTSLVGRCTVAAVHKIRSGLGTLYRFQGVALPKQIMLNHFAYRILERRAENLNKAMFPSGEEKQAIESG